MIKSPEVIGPRQDNPVRCLAIEFPSSSTVCPVTPTHCTGSPCSAFLTPLELFHCSSFVMGCVSTHTFAVAQMHCVSMWVKEGGGEEGEEKENWAKVCTAHTEALNFLTRVQICIVYMLGREIPSARPHLISKMDVLNTRALYGRGSRYDVMVLWSRVLITNSSGCWETTSRYFAMPGEEALLHMLTKNWCFECWDQQKLNIIFKPVYITCCS